MPADWINFINSVGAKLEGKDIEGSYDKPGEPPIDDFSAYLANQYLRATVGKAQSPYGNVHQQGNEGIIVAALSTAYKMMEDERSPTLEEKEKDPLYADLTDPVPEINIDDYLDKFDVEFRFWAEENGESIQDFTYSMFFSQFPNFPQTREQQVLEIARRIVYNFDGTSDYLQWIYSLKLDTSVLSDWTSQIYDKILELTSGIGAGEIKIGDDIQGIAYYQVNALGIETSNLDGFNVVRGKVVSIETLQNTNERFYKISYQSNNKTVTRLVKADTAQKKIDPSGFSRVQNLNLTKEIFQEEHVNNPERIPDYMTAQLITKFTYDPARDKNLFYRIITKILGYGSPDIQNQVSEGLASQNVLYNTNLSDFLNGNFSGYSFGYSTYISNSYLNQNSNDIQRARVRSLFDDNLSDKKAAYNSEFSRYMELKRRYIQFLADEANKQEDPDNANDPYYVMANGFIGYWISCLQQPLNALPPVPPCIVTPPGNGTYIGIYYGSRKRLANNLRRAFNTGKKFKGPGAGRVVAGALAFSFATHLLELKFIYNGGVPTPGGAPSPMIGIVPLVF